MNNIAPTSPSGYFIKKLKIPAILAGRFLNGTSDRITSNCKITLEQKQRALRNFCITRKNIYKIVCNDNTGYIAGIRLHRNEETRNRTSYRTVEQNPVAKDPGKDGHRPGGEE